MSRAGTLLGLKRLIISLEVAGLKEDAYQGLILIAEGILGETPLRILSERVTYSPSKQAYYIDGVHWEDVWKDMLEANIKDR